MSVEIIAEAAQGYEGNPVLARLLARGAATAGASAVKFQLVYADEIATPEYQSYDWYRKLEMTEDAWRTVAQEAKQGGARFYLDVFGERSLDLAMDLGVDGVKIHATDFFNTKLIRSALDNATRVFISLGGITVEELEGFIEFHEIAPSQPVCLLYGFQAAPTPLDLNNLRRINAWKRRFPGHQFGFMDHADGGSEDAMTLALMALSFDVDCIEKHITLDRTLRLVDHISALSLEQFQEFVRKIRHMEVALGSDDLGLTAAELEYRRRAMKVVVATRRLTQGETLSFEDVSLKRAAQQSPAAPIYQVEQVVGRTLSVDVQPGEQIIEEMLI